MNLRNYPIYHTTVSINKAIIYESASMSTLKESILSVLILGL